MTPDEAVDRAFLDGIGALAPQPPRAPALPVSENTSLTGTRCLEIFGSQLASRHLDLAARRLRRQARASTPSVRRPRGQRRGRGRAAARPTRRCCTTAPAASSWPGPRRCPARPGAATCCSAGRRGRRADRGRPPQGVRPPRARDHPADLDHRLAPAARGRRGVRHRPRAARLGVASAAGRPTPSWCAASATRRPTTRPPPAPSTPPCHCAYQRLPLPLLFVCEDNGLGISVRTPPGWIAAAYGSRPGLRYFAADGCRPGRRLRRGGRGCRTGCGERRRPAFLHLRMVRLLGHAGTDVGIRLPHRRPRSRADYGRDPLLATARLLVEPGVAGPRRGARPLRGHAAQVLAAAAGRRERPQLRSAAEVMAPLAPRGPTPSPAAAARAGDAAPRRRCSAARCPRTRARSRWRRRSTARSPTCWPATRSCWCSARTWRARAASTASPAGCGRFGAGRVFDTVLDEQSILGLALGAGADRPAAGAGDPVPRLPAQRRGPAARRGGDAAVLLRRPVPQPDGRARRRATPTRRASAATSTTTTRSPCCATSRGSWSPSPARPDDAAPMLRTCLAAAEADGRVCVFLEPIALYHTAGPARPRATAAGWRPTRARRWAAPTCRSAAAAPTATAAT